MAIKDRENLFGAWAFFIGVMLAIIGGVVLSVGQSVSPFVLGILTLLGLVLGFFIDVREKETNPFIVAAVSLVIVSFAGQQGLSTVEFGTIQIGKIISNTLSGLLVFLVPATIVVSIRTLFSIAYK